MPAVITGVMEDTREVVRVLAGMAMVVAVGVALVRGVAMAVAMVAAMVAAATVERRMMEDATMSQSF